MGTRLNDAAYKDDDCGDDVNDVIVLSCFSFT